jgi:hypothetical protein
MSTHNICSERARIQLHIGLTYAIRYAIVPVHSSQLRVSEMRIGDVLWSSPAKLSCIPSGRQKFIVSPEKQLQALLAILDSPLNKAGVVKVRSSLAPSRPQSREVVD